MSDYKVTVVTNPKNHISVSTGGRGGVSFSSIVPVYVHSNVASQTANAAYDFANSVSNYADIIFESSNLVNDLAISSYDHSNIVFDSSNSAYNTANSAYSYANDVNLYVSTGANAWANIVGTSANSYAESLTPNLVPTFVYANVVGASGNNYTNTVGLSGNNYANYVGNSANAYAVSLTPNLIPTFVYANTVGLSSNSYANTTVNTRIGWSNTWANIVSNYANVTANGWTNTIAASANSWANTKLANTTGTTFNGNFVVSGNLNAGNVIVSGQTTFISANSVTIGTSEVNSISLITSTTNDQIVDIFSASSYRAAQYMISMNAGTDYEVTQLNLIHNDSDAFMTEFGTILTTSNLLGTFSASYVSGNVRLNIVPTFAATTIRMLRMTNAT